jgi:hypothetical protein
MKTIRILIYSILAFHISTAEPEVKLSQKYEQVKAAGYSKWSEREANLIKGFMNNAIHVFAVKVSKELGAQLAESTAEVNIPKWAKVSDVELTGYFESKNIALISTQKGVTWGGKDNVICKVKAKPTYLFAEIILSADCVQYMGQYRQFTIDGVAKIKEFSEKYLLEQNQLGLSIENFIVSVGKPKHN